jgi:hypothetical protein
MRRAASAVALWALLLSVAGAQPAASIKATTFPPGQTPGPCVAFVVQAEGLDENAEFGWVVVPHAADDFAVPFRGLDGKPGLLFASSSSSVTLILQVAAPGLDELVQADLYQGEPEPDPEPDSDPEPEPDPQPGPVARLWALIVAEKTEGWGPDDRRPEEFLFISHDPKVLDWIAKNGHRWEYRDDDHPDEALKPYLDEASGQSLPRVFLVDEATEKTLWQGPLPDSPEKFLELLRHWGKEKASWREHKTTDASGRPVSIFLKKPEPALHLTRLPGPTHAWPCISGRRTTNDKMCLGIHLQGTHKQRRDYLEDLTYTQWRTLHDNLHNAR